VKRPISILLLIPCAVLLTGSTAMAKGPAPEGRTYFVYVMGLNDDPYEADADCLAFDATHACAIDDQICLTWQRAERGLQTNRESGFSVAAEINDDGLIITMKGQGRVNARGRKSSISVAAWAEALGFEQNFVFAGRQVGRARCLGMVEDFYEAQTAAR